MKPDERRQHILQCAKKIFSQRGYYGTQISDIVAEAGIARGTVYQYFANKDDIYVSLLEDYYRQWLVLMSEWSSAVDLSETPPGDYLRHRIRTTLKFFAKDRHLCNIVLRIGVGLQGDLLTASRRFEAKVLNLVVEDLKLGIRNNHLKKDLNVELTANLFAGALLRAAYLYFGHFSNRKTRVDIDKATEQIASILEPGILAG